MKFITKDINKPKSNIPDEKIGEVRTLALFSTIILLLFFSDLAYGGFVLEVGDKLFDASVRRDLNDIKAQFAENIYVASI